MSYFRKYAILTSICLLVVTGQLSAQVKVTFEVIAPKSPDKVSKIYLVGNDPALGDWDPGSIAMTQKNDSLWTYTAEFQEKKVLQFKITRGSWRSQAMFEAGILPDNILKVARPDLVIKVKPLVWSDEYFVPVGSVIGDIKYHNDFKSSLLRYPRNLIVWLPPTYGKDISRRYPVIYMQDGQNIIDPKTALRGYEWKVDETMDSLIRNNLVKEAIVVGVYHTPDREFEFIDGDQGKNYISFFVNELKPFIDKTYRTKPDRENTSVMGSAMGGLVSFRLAWSNPQIFKYAACFSPTFNLENDKILREVKTYKGPSKDLKIYLDCGTKGYDAELHRSFEEMESILKTKGYNDSNLMTFDDPNGDHDEKAWSSRFWRPVTFFLGN